RWRPVWPLSLARDLQQALPLEAVAPDADAVSPGAVVRLDQIEKALGGVDNDRARRLAGVVEHQLMAIGRVELGFCAGRWRDARISIADGGRHDPKVERRAVLGVTLRGDQTGCDGRQHCKLDTHGTHYMASVGICQRCLACSLMRYGSRQGP